jgi:hypothetical protein
VISMKPGIPPSSNDQLVTRWGDRTDSLHAMSESLLVLEIHQPAIIADDPFTGDD